MRLNHYIRSGLYLALIMLFLTGVAWLLVGLAGEPFDPSGWRSMRPSLLAVHGGVAMIFLVLLGALVPMHMQGNWRSRRNRRTGIAMLVLNGALIVTAYGLYYSGSDLVRGWASDLHIAAGLFAPPWILFHIWLGRRSLRTGGPVPAASRGRA